MEGTFKQNGAEIDGKKYQITGQMPVANLLCPEGHMMWPSVSPNRTEAHYHCAAEGCPYFRIAYRATPLAVHLEGVIDPPAK